MDGSSRRRDSGCRSAVSGGALAVWPGLAQIWSGQEALGLFLGVCFASVVESGDCLRWIWKEIFAPGWSDFFIIVAAAWWLASLAYTVWWVGSAIRTGTGCRSIGFTVRHKRLICKGGGGIQSVGWSRSWHGTRQMPMRLCNWRHFTSEPISRTWLARHCNSVYNQGKGRSGVGRSSKHSPDWEASKRIDLARKSAAGS